MEDRKSESGGDAPRVTPQNISIPLMMFMAAAAVVIGITWSVASYVNGLNNRLGEVEDAIADSQARDEAFERALGQLRTEFLHRVPLDMQIRDAFDQLIYPRDFTREARPRPKVAAVRRNLEIVDLAPMVTRDSVDRVWLSMSSRERLEISREGVPFDSTE